MGFISWDLCECLNDSTQQDNWYEVLNRMLGGAPSVPSMPTAWLTGLTALLLAMGALTLRRRGLPHAA